MTKTFSIADLPQTAEWLLQQVGTKTVIAFYGQMGAGKTTLIREICRQRGVVDTVTSPTFALINEYLCHDGGRVVHCDFYRLQDAGDALQLGVEEYFDSGDLCLIEWAEIVEPLLPPDAARVKMNVKGESEREIEIVL
jgi:tRNA threonylcarbamoyladenosine biosynthesis protein TsaE